MRHRKRLSSRSNRDRQGAAAVEMALTLPILFLILFACYEFGRSNMIRHTTQGAAYEAARAAIVPGATAEEARDVASAFLSTTGVSNFDLEIEPDVITDTTETVAVTITVRMQENSSIGMLFHENVVFEGFCELNRENF